MVSMRLNKATLQLSGSSSPPTNETLRVVKLRDYRYLQKDYLKETMTLLEKLVAFSIATIVFLTLGLYALQLTLLLPCYLYEKVTKKMAPDWIFKVAALIGKLNPINWIDLFD